MDAAATAATPSRAVRHCGRGAGAAGAAIGGAGGGCRVHRGRDAGPERRRRGRHRLDGQPVAQRRLRGQIAAAPVAPHQVGLHPRRRFGRQLAVGVRAQQVGQHLVLSLAGGAPLGGVAGQAARAAVGGVGHGRRSGRRGSAGERRAAPGVPAARATRGGRASATAASGTAWSSQARRCSATAPASSRRPREMRLMTVPIGTPSTSAISW
jgi:hypothetical protein